MKADVKHFPIMAASFRHVFLSMIVCAIALLCLPFTSLAQAADDDVTYRLVFMDDDDILNVRSAPGASNAVAGTLAPSAKGIRITGDKKIVGSSAWYPISASGLTGWVNGRFLTQEMDGVRFCSMSPVDFLEKLLEAVRLEDGKRLASMVDKERGLRLYLDAWNKGIQLKSEQLPAIFADSTKSTWGLDPESDPVEEGTFSENVLPLLQRDLLNHDVMTCNTMNRPEASGPHKLPKGTAGINYISCFRPSSDDSAGLDWGEWVVGVERWNGRFILSYLAHYHWTP